MTDPQYVETEAGTDWTDGMFCTNCGLMFGLCKPCFASKMARLTPLEKLEYYREREARQARRAERR